MLKANLIKSRYIQVVEVVNPEPGKGEVRVKLVMTGICGSDVHLFRKGRPLNSPLTIGHEGLGIIDMTGPGVETARKGERVVIEPNIPCGNCPECLSGYGNICRNKRIIGVTENGCLAEYVIAPSVFVWKIPESISEKDAVAIEPTAVAIAALNRSRSRPGDTIMVIGLGAVGLLITHIAIALGYKVLISEISESKMQTGTELGATPLDYKKLSENAEEEMAQICFDAGVKTIFECAGSEKTASLSIKIAPRGSEVMLLGLSDKPASFVPMDLLKKGIQINTSLIYDHPADFQRTIALIEKGIISPGFIVSRFFSLNDVQQALEEASAGNESKVVVKMQ